MGGTYCKRRRRSVFTLTKTNHALYMHLRDALVFSKCMVNEHAFMNLVALNKTFNTCLF
jgi:hypothetical protein